MNEAIFIIAEAGVNHNGDLSLGRKLVDAAADAGADAVKFQTFRASDLVSRTAPKAEYQLRTTDAAESQFDMIRRLELSEDDHEALIAHAASRGIAFLSTPFGLPSLDLLTRRLGLTQIKLGSGELTNGPLLLAAARQAQRLIVSTGMGSLAEVEAALQLLAFGFTTPTEAPTAGSREAAYASAAGQEALRARVTLLHCTTDYPAAFADVNLRAMTVLSQAFGLPVGYSDHTPEIHISLAAAALGATVIEKHLTVDRSLPGPDHEASLEPGEFSTLVRHIRDIELALGDGVKRPTAAEHPVRDVARKSLVAARVIAPGEAFTEESLACKRPGTGVSPMRYWSYLGEPAHRSFEPDELIS